MTALIATIKKELLLLLRDIHGLLLLFVMPVAFILIMSLALQSQFAQNAGGQKIAVLVDDQARSDSAASVIKLLEQRDVFSWHVTDTLSAPEKIRHDEAAFLLTLQQNNNDLHAEILVAPATNPQIEAIFTAVVGEAMSKQRIEALLRNIKMKRALDSDFSLDDGIDEDALNSNPVTIQYSYQKNQTTSVQPASAQPTSVQQSVPAWLVFAMFFSVVPLANTLISERQQGTLRRLRTLPVGSVFCDQPDPGVADAHRGRIPDATIWRRQPDTRSLTGGPVVDVCLPEHSGTRVWHPDRGGSAHNRSGHHTGRGGQYPARCAGWHHGAAFCDAGQHAADCRLFPHGVGPGRFSGYFPAQRRCKGRAARSRFIIPVWRRHHCTGTRTIPEKYMTTVDLTTLDLASLKTDLKSLIVVECDKDIEPGSIDDDAILIGGDLDLDSLDALQISMAVKNRYGVSIEGGPEARRALKSVNTLADTILNFQRD